MEEGVIMWAIFTKEGKAALRMDYEVHPENGKVGYGRLLSPDVSVLHESSHRMMLTGFFPFLNTGFRYGSGCAYDIRELRTG